MNDVAQTAWIDDPDVVLFVTDEQALAIGAVERQGLGETVGRVFGRSKEEVGADFAKAFDQMRMLLHGLTPGAHGYEASEVTFELAFSAQGRIAFVAEAGMSSSISITFTRAKSSSKPSAEGGVG